MTHRRASLALLLLTLSACEMTPPGVADAGPPPTTDGGAPTDGATRDASAPLDASRGLPDAAPCEAPTRWYRDRDRDGAGDPSDSVERCARPEGYVADARDCDDDCAACHPDGRETCDEVDQDCDGLVDEGVQRSYYADRDGDGHGDRDMRALACAVPMGFVDDASDCDDTCGACHPGAPETCDGVDQDCDLSVDEGVLSTFHRDADGDGWGAGATTQACAAPPGYADRAGDCDDASASRFPGASETCDGADDDCDGAPDQTFACVRGASTSCTTVCGSTGTGACSASCNPPALFACTPPAESCNFSDDDCDGLRDEGVLAWDAPAVEAPTRAYERPVVVELGSSRRSFWYADGDVYGFEQTAGGLVTGGPVPLTATRRFHAASHGTSTIAFASAFGSYVILQRLNANLTTRWSTTIPVSASQVRVSVDASHVNLYTVESGGRLRRRVYRLTDHRWLAGPIELGRTSRPFTVTPSAGGDLVAFASTDLRDVELRWVRGASATPAITARTIASPALVWDVAVASTGGTPTPDAMLAWSTRGGSASDSEIRYAFLASLSSSPDLGRVTTGTTPDDPVDPSSRIGLAVHGDTYFLGVVHTSSFPIGATGTPRAFQLMIRSGVHVFDVSRVSAGGAFPTAAHEGIAVTYAQARIWYAPPGDGIASRWANCAP